MRFIRRFIVSLFATIGVITVLVIAAVAFGGWWVVNRLEHVRGLPSSMVLVADLRGSIDDQQPTGLGGLRFDRDLGLSDIVLALDRAAGDSRVKGLVVRLDDTGHGFAGAQELRDAVKRFGATGRPTVAFADSFGELGPANEGYYLATAFSRIVLQPVGLVGLTGLTAEVPFFKPLLDRLGIVADVQKREAYKSALDSATETGLTPANREMLEQMLRGLSEQLANGIGEGRKLDAGRVAELVNGGPYDADEANAAGLIDEVGYWDEVLGNARRGARTVELENYADFVDSEGNDGIAVAFVRATGVIARGSGLAGIGADDFADALSDAVDDRDVRAILMRVDSPGGSAVASETVARQIRRAVDAGKPVIVTMGNAAASGGYWISMDATKIVAQPGTLTGSIGVIAGKPVLAGLWQQLGVNWEALPQAENADMWSVNAPFAGKGKQRITELLDAIYAQFKDGVATGRKLDPARVEEIAQGRVWLGSDAVKLGLVDELGGLYEAQIAVRDALGMSADSKLDLRPYPAPRSPFDRVRDVLGGVQAGWIEMLFQALAEMGQTSPVRMPAVNVR